MKKFNKGTFVSATILIGLLLIPSFMAAWAEDEGTLGYNSFWLLFSKLFYLFRFPTHTLMWTVFSNGATMYFLGLLINCMFWGLLIERLSWLVKKKLI